VGPPLLLAELVFIELSLLGLFEVHETPGAGGQILSLVKADLILALDLLYLFIMNRHFRSEVSFCYVEGVVHVVDADVERLGALVESPVVGVKDHLGDTTFKVLFLFLFLLRYLIQDFFLLGFGHLTEFLEIPGRYDGRNHEVLMLIAHEVVLVFGLSRT